MNVLQHCTLKCFAAAGEKSDGDLECFYSTPHLFSFCLWADILMCAMTSVTYGTALTFSWPELHSLFTAFPKEKKNLLLFPNFNRGKLRAVLVLISGSDHLYDRLSASFHLFLLFQQEFTEMDSPLCACIWSLTRFSIECCLVSLTANTLLCYALLTWNVACRDSWTWAS